jgi:hypothetical protein
VNIDPSPSPEPDGRPALHLVSNGGAANYVASPVNRRRRRTNAELGEVDAAIVAAVAADNPVTLRGVYYRVVSAGVVDKTEAGYRLVGRQLLKLRRDGTIPYSYITDGTRWITKPTTWTGLDQMLDDAAASYRRALWHEQSVEVHLFTEKDAISGVVLPVTEKWDVPLGVLRGYASESFSHSVAEAIKDSAKRTVVVYQLGDSDPSGVDAWRSFRETVAGFLGQRVTPDMASRAANFGIPVRVDEILGVDEDEDYAADFTGDDDTDAVAYSFIGGPNFHYAGGRHVVFQRLAVTERQIEEWGLPPRPTKTSDTRARHFSGSSVEVDAIPAGRLRDLVESAIVGHIDPGTLARLQMVEEAERATLEGFLRAWGGRSR